MWIRMRRAWDWRTQTFTVAYRDGRDYSVPKRAALQAIKAGAAVELRRKNRNEPFEEVEQCQTAES